MLQKALPLIDIHVQYRLLAPAMNLQAVGHIIKPIKLSSSQSSPQGVTKRTLFV